MIRTKKAMKLLTKKEQRHLTEIAGVHSMAAMVRTAKAQKVMRKEGVEPCFECKHIAIKLGLEV